MLPLYIYILTDFYLSTKLMKQMLLLHYNNMLQLSGSCVNAYELCNGSGIFIESFNKDLTVKTPKYPQNYSIATNGCNTTVVITVRRTFVFNIKRKGVSRQQVMVQDTNGVALPYQYNLYEVEDGDIYFTHNVIVRTNTSEVLTIHLPAGEGKAFIFTAQGRLHPLKNACLFLPF